MRAKRPGVNGNRGETTQGVNRIRGETTRYQKFSTLIRLDICESMVGLHGCEIEKHKLFFFGKLCKMDNGYLVKNIFIHRLFTCMSDNGNRIGI